MTLTDFRTLGDSGLIVSPLTLGTMTFGAARWGANQKQSKAIFEAYVEAGGNAIDTADVYSNGQSEAMLGEFIAERSLRHDLVLATKAGFHPSQGNPNAGGNGAKHLYTALKGSLERLRTDYIDLYWIHVWDMVTPPTELLSTLVDMVRAGHIRYFGLSNFPAWYVAELATRALSHNVPGPIAMQLEYSLTERSIELEHIPLARRFGMGVMPWSPLDGGFLTGKYDRVEIEAQETKRSPGLPTDASNDIDEDKSSRLAGANPFGDTKFTARNWHILEEVKAVAEENNTSPAQVAIAWFQSRPTVDSVLLGASKLKHLQANIEALDNTLKDEQVARLDEAGAPTLIYPYFTFTPDVNRMVFGGETVLSRASR